MRRQGNLVYLVQIGILATAYLITARIGLSLSPVGGFATLVWPPSGISLVALILGGFRLWPGIFAGALLANLHMGAPLPAALGIAIGNTTEPLLGAFLLLQLAHFDTRLNRLRDVTALLLSSAGVSTITGATIGVFSLWLNGLIPASILGATWRAWWIGDALGILVIAPLLFTWIQGFNQIKKNSRRTSEGLALIILVITASTLIFLEPVQRLVPNNGLPIPFVLFPLTIWAALRFGQLGAVTTTLLVSLIAIWGTIHGLGPFGRLPLDDGLVYLDSYIGSLVVTGLFLAAAIAEREQAEMEARSLLAREEEAVRVRDEFLSIASHELKTPLTSLKLQLEMAKRALNTERIEKALASSNRQVARLTTLVEDLLDVSRIQAGKLTYAIEAVDLAEVTRECADQLSEQIASANCRIEFSLQPTVVGQWDRSRIEQVLINLLSNAIKYAPGCRVRVTVTSHGQIATLIVEDDGPGIAEEKQLLIFERFERATSSRSITGLGLGLFIAKKIIESHRGTIQVESVVPTGAKFTVKLPL